MSVRVDFEEALQNLRVIRANFDDSLKRLEKLMIDHFELTGKTMPRQMMQSLDHALTAPGDGKAARQ